MLLSDHCPCFEQEIPPESVTLNRFRCRLANIRRCRCELEESGLIGKLRPISGLAAPIGICVHNKSQENLHCKEVESLLPSIPRKETARFGGHCR